MKKINWNDKDKIENAVLSSKNYGEVFEKLGLRYAGGNANTLKKYIGKHGIKTNFETQESRNKRIGKTKTRKLEDILVVDSSFSNRHYLKEKLYNAGLKKRECEKCGQGEIWQGLKISLILDHVNGIYNDNRLINLKIYCPNCNATLETHCRNKK